jgi:hypothetical protein
MGLTRLRAEQISDIDYKQAVRVITVTDIATLSGGAPSQVDGVSLSVGDRILVTAQDPGNENGIYQVQTVGTGSNGTWIRSLDTNQTGELEAGTIVMVTEGTTYADTQWKLTTNNPIIIGTTPLTFEQNSAYAFGNIYANGTAVLANSVGSTVTFTAGNNIQITGNNTSKSVTIGVTGISLNSISNGTSNVNVVSSGGNVTVGVGGTGNVVIFSSNGANITGTTASTSKTTGALIVGGGLGVAGTTYNNRSVTQGAYGNIILNEFTGIYNQKDTGTSLIQTTTNALSAGLGIQVTGAAGNGSQIYSTGTMDIKVGVAVRAEDTPTGGTVIASVASTGLIVTGLVSATGNITGGNILGNGAGLSGINTFSNVTVTGGNSAVADSISDTLTLTAGDGIAIVIDSATDTITIAASGGSEIFVDGADFGTVTEPVTLSDDLGLVTDLVDAESDLGTMVTSGLIYPDQFVLPSYTTSTLPSASVAGAMIYVTNEAGGAVPAFADGTNWRRVTDRTIVT